MVLVDTSIWVEHFREGNEHLKTLLEEGIVLCHPFIIGELACGNMKNCNEILELLKALPQAPVAEFTELLNFIERFALMGKGIGFVDVNLLAAALLAECALWTRDTRLAKAAGELGIVWSGV